MEVYRLIWKIEPTNERREVEGGRGRGRRRASGRERVTLPKDARMNREMEEVRRVSALADGLSAGQITTDWTRVAAVVHRHQGARAGLSQRKESRHSPQCQRPFHFSSGAEGVKDGLNEVKSTRESFFGRFRIEFFFLLNRLLIEC